MNKYQIIFTCGSVVFTHTNNAIEAIKIACKQGGYPIEWIKEVKLVNEETQDVLKYVKHKH